MFPVPPTAATRRHTSVWLLALLVPVAGLSEARVPTPPPAVQSPDPDAPAEPEIAKSRLVVVPYPIVDPALGNGVLGGPVWMRGGPPTSSGPAKPQAFGVGALWTDGGSRGVVAFDHRAWKGGAWRSTALVGDVDLHFAYSGLEFGQDDGFGFAIAAQGGSLSAERRLGTGPITLSVQLFSAQADVSPEAPPSVEIAGDIGTSTLSGITLGWARDTRDDVFLPSDGTAMSVNVTVIPEALGASFNSQRVALKWTHYRPMGQGVIGLRAKSDLSFDDPPFYLRPFISFRGVAALRYAGEQVVSVETEYRHPIHGRWDGLVFAASGHARSDFRGFERDKTVSAVGVGVRFKAVKLFGLTFGLDLAQGPDGTVGYIQIGNAWSN
ncbi:MAG: BamA/TamA family outer membrane protein [Arenimonas sp.]|nr:BamA/TamA family outer membrane protein [Arenimonas sp.]